MIGQVVGNILRFLFLILLQALVLDHLDVANGMVVPSLYVLFVLMLPFELPAWALLLLGFGTGSVMDVFTSTPGMHAAACTVLAYARPHVLRLIAPREGYEFGLQPTVQDMGLSWAFTYIGLLVLLHHLTLFQLEAFGSGSWWRTLLRILLSSTATLLLCLLAQWLTARPVRGRT
ncbi:MAG: rod shape-determining protein MreD [Flavobacteriales bacterium]|nr:rod shape-determining protein MreD [Flavobacteriales bacterium]